MHEGQGVYAARPALTCYPQPSKAKSRVILESFAAGCGGRLAACADLEAGPAAFYGVVGIESLFNHARARGDWWYGDNSFFDRSRGQFYRFTRNAFQPSALCPPDWARWRSLGFHVKPWRKVGRHVVVVEQSAHFMRLSGAGSDWLDRTVRDLRRATDRPFRVRAWDRNKAGATATLSADLANAWALVTHMSAAANEALLAGVPVFVTGPCAALPLASGDMSAIDWPRYPDGREDWAAGLAGRQFTLEELRSGMAWSALHG